jgi:hypothetical protein
MIQSYSFGKIIIRGKSYSRDLIIYPDRVEDNWWRKEGHLLLPQDLEKVVREKPEILIVGTGYSGLMKVPASTKEWIDHQGIKLRVEPTQEACRIYNQLYSSKKVIAVLHLTC